MLLEKESELVEKICINNLITKENTDFSFYKMIKLMEIICKDITTVD